METSDLLCMFVFIGAALMKRFCPVCSAAVGVSWENEGILWVPWTREEMFRLSPQRGASDGPDLFRVSGKGQKSPMALKRMHLFAIMEEAPAFLESATSSGPKRVPSEGILPSSRHTLIHMLTYSLPPSRPSPLLSSLLYNSIQVRVMLLRIKRVRRVSILLKKYAASYFTSWLSLSFSHNFRER